MASTIQQEINELNQHAVSLHRNGKICEATTAARHAVEFARKHLTNQDQLLVACLDNLAVLCRAQGEYQAAESAFLESLSITRNNFGEDDPDYIATLGELSSLYLAIGNFEQAEKGYRTALQAISNALGQQNEMYLRSLLNLASLCKKKGDFQEAEVNYQEAQQIAKSIWNSTGPNFAILLNNIAQLDYEQGRYENARIQFLQSLELTKNSLGEQHPQFARTLICLGSVAEARGEFSRSAEFYETAILSLQKSLGDVAEVAKALNNLAGIHKSMGDFERAEALLQQALAIWGKLVGTSHPDFATGLSNLADVHFSKGDYVAARQHFETAMEIRRQTIGENHPDFALSLNSMGVVSKSMGEFNQAYEYLKQALTIACRVHDRQHPTVAIALHNLGALRHDQGDYEQSEQFFSQSIEISRATLGEYHPTVAETLHRLAALSVATHKLSQAVSFFDNASVIDNRLIEHFFTIGGEQQRLAYMQTIQSNLDAFLSLVLKYFQHDAAVVRKAFDLVLRRKAIVLESVISQRNSILQERFPESRQKLKALAAEQLKIARIMRGDLAVMDSHERARQLSELEASIGTLKNELAQDIPETHQAVRLKFADTSSVANCLSEGAVLLEFVRIHHFDFQAVPARNERRFLSPRYLVFGLTMADGAVQLELFDLGEAQKIDDLVASLKNEVDRERNRRSISFGDADQPIEASVDSSIAAFDRIGRDLHTAVFGCLSTMVEKHKRWFLAADGELACLPFEVLPKGNGRRIIDDHEISYLSVARELVSLDNCSALPMGEPLVVADPDFNLTSDGDEHADEPLWKSPVMSRDLTRFGIQFDRLPGTHAEGLQIGALLETQPLLGKSATKARVKVAASPGIVHFATHGYFLPDLGHQPNTSYLELLRLGAGFQNPLLRTGLALAGAMTYLKGGRLPAEAEDGILSGEDLRGMDLSATRLVVLSACDTGLGDIRAGEGVFGLRRAAAISGARTLIMSLWKVPDEQTQQLMILFYREILNNEPISFALRKAQLNIKERYPHPFHWGAFICQGNPNLGVDKYV